MSELHELVSRWPLIPVESAIQLLDYAYPDERVHEYAVRCLRYAYPEYVVRCLRYAYHEYAVRCLRYAYHEYAVR